MIFSHIVAISKNYVIGRDGKMPWHISEDLKRFKKRTTGHSVIMGRKTFESLGKPLPGRENVIITKNKNYFKKAEENVVVFTSIEEAVNYCKQVSQGWDRDEVFIIGGGEIYKQTAKLIDKIYITVINDDTTGDTFYPRIDEKKFKEVEKENLVIDGKEISFITYQNRLQE